MSEGKRLVSAFFAPTSLYEDLRQRPRWVVPLLVVLGVVVATSVFSHFLINPEVRMEAIRESMPQGFELTEEQLQTMQETRDTRMLIGLAVTAVGLVAGFFIYSLILWGVFAVFGGKVGYSHSLSIVSYSGLVVALGMIIISVLAVVLQRVDITASLAFLPFIERGSFWYAVAARISFFAVWRTLLIGEGFSVVAGLKRNKSYPLALAVWLALTFIQAGFPFLARSFFGPGRM